MSGRLMKSQVEFFKREGYVLFNQPVFPQEKFDTFVSRYMTDAKSPDEVESRAEQLVETIRQHLGRTSGGANPQTLDALLTSDSNKAKPFLENGDAKTPYISGITAPDPKTLVITLNKPWLQLLSNLVPVPIVPQGSAGQQKDKPLGCGAFKFISYDNTNKIVELEAFDKYAGGAPAIKKVRVKVIIDAGTLQADIIAVFYTSRDSATKPGRRD